NAGRRGGHEAVAEGAGGFDGASQAIDLPGDGGRAEIPQLVSRFRSVLHLAALGKALHQDFNKLGKFLIVAAAASLRFAGEAGYSLSDESGESDSLLFSVVADIDAGGRLLFDDVANGPVHRLPQALLIDRLSLFAFDQQVGKLVVAR